MELLEAYKFCPRCSKPLSKLDNHLHCAFCGLVFYQNPKPVQSLILKNEKNEYLLVIRAIEPKKGYLDFPGGFVEEGENFEEASRREAREELGIDIGDLEYLNSHTDEYLYQGINYKVTGVVFTGTLLKDTKIKVDDDVAGYEFYKLNKIPMDRLAWPSMHEMIKKLGEI